MLTKFFPIRDKDILVVAPYNAQVRCLRAKLPASIAVGTVDKFQGQEADRLLLDGDLERREPAVEPQVPLLARPAERGGLAGTLPRLPRRELKLLEIGCRTVEQMRMVTHVVASQGRG